MKTKLLILGVLLAMMALPYAIATEKYKLKDFAVEPMQGIILEEGDIIEFDMFNATHFARIKEIGRSNSSIMFYVYPFSGKNEAVPGFGLENVVYVDLNKDDNDDIAFDIQQISDRRVTLLIKAMEQEPSAPVVTETPQGQGLVKKSVQKNHYRTFFAIAMVAVALLGLLAIRKQKNGKGIEEEKPKHEHHAQH